MNNCIDNYQVYKNRTAVASYSRRTRSIAMGRSLRALWDTLLNLCCTVVAFFERDTVRALFRISVAVCACVSFFVIVAAVDNGVLGFGPALLAIAGIITGCRLAFLL